MQQQNHFRHALPRLSVAMLAAGLIAAALPLHARAVSDLLISEYVEGSSNNNRGKWQGKWANG